MSTIEETVTNGVPAMASDPTTLHRIKHQLAEAIHTGMTDVTLTGHECAVVLNGIVGRGDAPSSGVIDRRDEWEKGPRVYIGEKVDAWKR